MSLPQKSNNAPSLAPFKWDDPFLLDEQLSEEERMIQDAARSFAQAELVPLINDAYMNEETDPGLFKKNKNRRRTTWPSSPS
ncbi:MAG: hypothetical protein GY761_21885, partial [Hyphomicrobiales bacterium]|nr:hypothetical protein [Hyphomicrobiales bacterium]